MDKAIHEPAAPSGAEAIRVGVLEDSLAFLLRRAQVSSFRTFKRRPGLGTSARAGSRC
jgi:hypothetical protein